MTFFESVLLYFSAATSAFLLIAGGWVKIRDWFKTKAAAKAAAVAAAAQAKEAEIEAEVQERLKKLQQAADEAPKATATSTTGPVTA